MFGGRWRPIVPQPGPVENGSQTRLQGEAETASEKLAATVGFLRAVVQGNEKGITQMQRIYPRLRDVPPTPRAAEHPGFAALQDHAIKLSHAAVAERLEELRSLRAIFRMMCADSAGRTSWRTCPNMFLERPAPVKQ